MRVALIDAVTISDDAKQVFNLIKENFDSDPVLKSTGLGAGDIVTIWEFVNGVWEDSGIVLDSVIKSTTINSTGTYAVSIALAGAGPASVILDVTGRALTGNALEGSNMILVMKTTTAGETVTIPAQDVGVFNATISWGDGTPNSGIGTWNSSALTHTYAEPGEHKIGIIGSFPNIYFNDNGAKLVRIENLGNTGLTTLDRAFRGCVNLLSVTGYANISLVTSMSSAFQDCTKAYPIDVSNWDTSLVTDMSGMFLTCSSLIALDVSGWDTSKVTDMPWMFRDTPIATLDVSGWDTSKVTEMSGMFQQCHKLTSINVLGWDTSKVTAMPYMFYQCFNLKDIAIDAWNISAVTLFDQYGYGFMRDVQLNTARYDAILIAWDAQIVQTNLDVDFGLSTHTVGGAAEVARVNLETTDGWTIYDSTAPSPGP